MRRWRFLAFATTFLLYLQQIVSGCHIHPEAEIGNQCHLPHPVGIVIGKHVRIGDHVTIFQNVTLGSHGRPDQAKQYPTVGDYAIIYAGALIIGNIHIGEYAVVGAGSVVTRSVPNHGLVYGNTARLRGFVCKCGQKLPEIPANSNLTSMHNILLKCMACKSEIAISEQDYRVLETS